MSNQHTVKCCGTSPAPRVSVLIPTYRRNHFLVSALRSVIAQTYWHFEVIISDNANDSSTRELVASFGDARLKYRSNSPSVPVFENHCIAWREARGEYIAFLHDDDEWEPSFLAALVKSLDEHPECVLAFSEQLIIGPSGEPSLSKTEENKRRWNRRGLRPGVHRPFWNLIVYQSIPIVMGGMFRRSALSPEDIPKESHTALDFWMAYTLCRSGGGVYYVPEMLMHYRAHDGSETARPSDVRLGPVYCWKKLLREPEIRPYRKVVHAKAAEAHTHVTTLLILNRQTWRANWHAQQALWHRPSIRRAGLLLLTFVPNAIGRRVVGRLLHAARSAPPPAMPANPPVLPRGITT